MPILIDGVPIHLLHLESSGLNAITRTASRQRLRSKLRRYGVQIACSLEVLQETLATRDASRREDLLAGLRAVRCRLVGLPSFVDVICIHNQAHRLPRRAIEESTRILQAAIDGHLPPETLSACYERGARLKVISKDADACFPSPSDDLDLLCSVMARSKDQRRYMVTVLTSLQAYGPSWTFRCRSRTSKPLQAFAIANACRIAMRATGVKNLPGHVDMFQAVYFPFVQAIAQRDTGFAQMSRTICERLRLATRVTTWETVEAALFQSRD